MIMKDKIEAYLNGQGDLACEIIQVLSTENERLNVLLREICFDIQYGEYRVASDKAVKFLYSPKKDIPNTNKAQVIIDRTCHVCCIDKKQILSAKRDRKLSRPRQICAYLIRKHLQLSFSVIAEKLKRGDHTTIVHACNNIQMLIAAKHEDVIETIDRIERILPWTIE